MDKWEAIGTILTALALGILIGMLIMAMVARHDIKNAQIDALTGNIHYELITHDDSTRTWERIEP